MTVRRTDVLVGFIFAVSLVLSGCDLAARAGHDMETAGDRITRAAHGVSDTLFGPPVMTEGHSPERPAATGGESSPAAPVR